MHWITPSEKDTDNAALEKRLWHAADHFRGNSGLKSQGRSAPGFGLSILRSARKRAQSESPSPLGPLGETLEEPRWREYQALPDEGRPVRHTQRQRDVWYEVQEGLRKVLDDVPVNKSMSRN